MECYRVALFCGLRRHDIRGLRVAAGEDMRFLADELRQAHFRGLTARESGAGDGAFAGLGGERQNAPLHVHERLREGEADP